MLSQELQAAVLGQRVTGCFSTVVEGIGQHKVNSYSRTVLAAEGRRKVAQLLLHEKVLFFFTPMLNITWNTRENIFFFDLNLLRYFYYGITLCSTLISKEPLLKHADIQTFTSKCLVATQPSISIVLFKPASFLFLCLPTNLYTLCSYLTWWNRICC